MLAVGAAVADKSGPRHHLAQHILAERGSLDEDLFWGVVNALGDPPAPGSDARAVTLVPTAPPRPEERQIRVVLREWRAHAGLAAEEDGKDPED